jgi:hypothetical protein
MTVHPFSQVPLFEANKGWGNGVLVPLLERLYDAEFPRVANPRRGSWFAARLAQRAGYAQLSSVYSAKRNLRYVLDPSNPALFEGLRRGSGTLLLDGSGEGIRFWTHPFDDLHRNLDRLEIPADRIIFVNSSVTWAGEYAAWQQKSAFRTPIGHALHNYYVTDMVERMGRAFGHEAISAIRSNFLWKLQVPVPLTKRFVFTNFAPRAHRVFMLLDLVANDTLRHGFVSLPSLANKNVTFPEESSAAPLFPALLDRYGPHLPRLERFLPLLLDGQAGSDSNEMLASFLPPHHFADSCFSIVAETDFGPNGEPARRYTEKTLQAMLHLHPFVVVGDPGVLTLLREFGFRTFSPFIDECYDAITDPAERLAAVGREVARLCALSAPAMREGLRGLAEVLTHNHRLVLQARGRIRELWDEPLLHKLNSGSTEGVR